MSFTPYPNQRMLIVPERACHTVECGRTVNRRTRLALHAPTPAFGRRTAAFGRSLPSAAVDRRSRDRDRVATGEGMRELIDSGWLLVEPEGAGSFFTLCIR